MGRSDAGRARAGAPARRIGVSGLAEIGAALLGGVLRRAWPIHGGDLSEVLRIILDDGREAIVKNGPAPRTEAQMLRAIAAAGAPAPAVLAASDEALVMAPLPSDGGVNGAWASLGEALATLHASLGPRYGWPADYAFGQVAIENGWSEDWPRFWGGASRRWRRIWQTACRRGRRRPFFMAISGAAIFWRRAAGSKA